MKAQYSILERDDAILIPDDGTKHDDFQPVDVELADGVTTTDIDTDKVVLLESPDNNRLRFELCTPDAWNDMYPKWEAAGWMPIGLEMIRWYNTHAEYQATIDE